MRLAGVAMALTVVFCAVATRAEQARSAVVPFAQGRVDIDARAERALRRVQPRAGDRYVIAVEGAADARPSSPTIAADRAKTITWALERLGVNPERIIERTGPADATPATGRAIVTVTPVPHPPRWNHWIVIDGQAGESHADVPVDHDFTLSFDLSQLTYDGTGDPTSESSASDDASLTEWLATTGDNASFFAQAHVITTSGPENLRYDGPPLVSGNVDLTRLRNPVSSPAGAARSQADMSVRYGATRVPLRFHATAGGCSVVVLMLMQKSSTDATLLRPFAITSASVRVTPDAAYCRPEQSASIATRHLFELLRIPIDVDAMLLVADLGGNVARGIAAYSQRGMSPLLWTLPRMLSTAVMSPSELPNAIKQARTDPSKKYDLRKVSDHLETALFAGESASDQDTGTRALTALRDLAAKGPARIRARFIGPSGGPDEGTPFYVPLGLLAVGPPEKRVPLGSLATIIQPLDIPSDLKPGTCVDAEWMVIPELSDVAPKYKSTKLLSDLPSVNDTPDVFGPHLIRDWERFKNYLGNIPPVANPEAFLILAHHGNGTMSFTEGGQDSISVGNLRRFYRPGSVAFLIACEAGAPSTFEKRPEWIVRLNRRMVDTILFSPFEIPSDVAARIAASLSQELINARSKPDDTLVDDVIRNALDRAQKDEAEVCPTCRLPEIRHELVIAGNRFTKICGTQHQHIAPAVPQ